jgi:hypothetical protein
MSDQHFAGVPPADVLPFAVIRDELERALEACSLKIERQGPTALDAHPALRLYLAGTVRASANAFHAIRFMLADSPPSDGRKLEFAFAAPPLNRMFLEAVFLVLYLFEDLGPRWQQFTKQAGGRLTRISSFIGPNTVATLTGMNIFRPWTESSMPSRT